MAADGTFYFETSNGLKPKAGGNLAGLVEAEKNIASAKGGGAPEGAAATNDTPLGLGSTGRTVANNLSEQLAMKQAMSNPAAGSVVPMRNGMTDSRWPGADGWVKMTQNVNGVEIHYVRNITKGSVDDFKFK